MSLKDIFIKDSTLKSHIAYQTTKRDDYIANLFLLFFRYNMKFSIIKKARILVASLTRKDNELSEFLLKNFNYKLPEIAKACNILDSRRYIVRLHKKKLKKNADESKHKSKIANLGKLHESIHLSLNNSKIKFITKHWIKNIPKDELEFSAIQYTIGWKKLIDLFHLKPSDFQLEWFTKYIFTSEAPKTSVLYNYKQIKGTNIHHLAKSYKIPFAYLKSKHKNLLDDKLKKIVSDYTPLDEVIKHWEHLNTPEVYVRTIFRLNKENDINMMYGELIKRIQMMGKKNKLLTAVNDMAEMLDIPFQEMTHRITNLDQEDLVVIDCLENIAHQFHINVGSLRQQIEQLDLTEKEDQVVTKMTEIAEKKLSHYKLHIQQPVAVFGDASASMGVAIRTSSIITSVLCKLAEAKLHLFRNVDEVIKNPPRNVRDVLKMGKECKAFNSTSPAASMMPYLKNKEVIKTFIIVTDEEENTHCEGKRFSEIYKEYRKTVYPAELVFISFIEGRNDGQMVTDLKETVNGIEKDIIQFRLNGHKPDLRKLDTLLNTLEMNSNIYNEECKYLLSLKKFDLMKEYLTETDQKNCVSDMVICI